MLPNNSSARHSWQDVDWVKVTIRRPWIGTLRQYTPTFLEVGADKTTEATTSNKHTEEKLLWL